MTENADDNTLREEMIRQLKESLGMSWGMMSNPKLDAKAREEWTQIHTNTAQILNRSSGTGRTGTGRNGSRKWKRLGASRPKGVARVDIRVD